MKWIKRWIKQWRCKHLLTTQYPLPNPDTWGWEYHCGKCGWVQDVTREVVCGKIRWESDKA